MDVVVWNMRQLPVNWELLRPGNPLEANVQILCEAPKPPFELHAVGQWRTIGLADDLPLDRPVKREWSTAVAAAGSTHLTDARRAREYTKEVLPLPFKPSRPGTWTAARIPFGRKSITAIALYGLLDEKSDASVHRSLSELSPIFDHRVYRKYILLGGDLNIFANPRPDDSFRKRHRAVLARLESYGLTDCLSGFKRPLRQAIEDPCPCGVIRCRQHWRTYRKSIAAPGRAYQEDYLFASGAMTDALLDCEVLPFEATSDHAPIRASFSI